MLNEGTPSQEKEVPSSVNSSQLGTSQARKAVFEPWSATQPFSGEREPQAEPSHASSRAALVPDHGENLMTFNGDSRDEKTPEASADRVSQV